VQVGMRLAERKQLETKMREVFQKELEQLSQDYQSVLADDMVTAFLNRLTLLVKVQMNNASI